MSYLAQGLLGGFNAGFAAGTNRKRDDKLKAERDAERALRQERQLIEDARYNDQLSRQQERQIVDDARWEQQQKIAAEQRAEASAQRQLDNDMKKTAYVDQRLDRTMDLARQTRQDFSAEIEKARRDPLIEARLAEEARALKLQNDAFGQPKPMQATERLEYDPADPTGEPKRILTGPLGFSASLGLGGDAATVPAGAPASPAAPKLSAQDEQMIARARESLRLNPNDARARAVLRANGLAE